MPLPSPPGHDAVARARPLAGMAAIALGLGFNIPYALLAATYDYPGILRRPAGEALALFAAGGAPLILTWHVFALCALLFVPMAIFLPLTPSAIGQRPALAVGAALAGALSGLAQAIGLWRWVFVVPGLARAHQNPDADGAARLAAEQTFVLINQYGGVAIGEHLGQLLMALFALLLSALQWAEDQRKTAILGFLTAASILLGTNEGVALALGRSGDLFGLATILGFAVLTIWLIATGVGQMRPSPRPPRRAE